MIAYTKALLETVLGGDVRDVCGIPEGSDLNWEVEEVALQQGTEVQGQAF